MRKLYDKPQCRCCLTLRQYISDHLLPDMAAEPDEDPEKVYDILKRCFPDGVGVSLEELREYLKEINNGERS